MNPIFEKVIKDHYGQKTAETYDRMAYDFFWCYSDILKVGAFNVAYQLFHTHRNKREVKILDLGAGTGNFCCEILNEIKKFEKVKGAENLLQKVHLTLKDQSIDMLTVANSKIRKQFNLSPQNIISNLNNETELAHTYDVVISSFAVHHLDFINKLNLFKYIKKILSSDGFFILVDRIHTEDSAELQKNLTAVSSRFFSTNDESLDLTIFNNSIQKQFNDDGDQPSTETEHRNLLAQAGFSHVKMIYYSGPTAAWMAQ